MNYRFIFSVIAFCAMAVSQAQSLEYFVDLAKESHPEVKAKSLQLQAMEQREGQMTTWNDPMLSAGYNVVANSMEKYNVTLMQDFAWFGTAKHQRAAARAAASSGAYQLLALEKQVEVDVASLYYQIQEIEELMLLQEQNLETYRQLETLANNKLSTAQGAMVDVIRAELAKENILTQNRLLQQRRESMVQALNRLVGRASEEPIRIELVEYSNIGLETNLEQHPEIVAIDSRIEEGKESILATQKESLPVWGIGVEYMRMEPDRNEFMPMVSLSLPIFRKKHKARIAEAELLSASYEYEKEWALNQLYRERVRLKNEIQQAEIEMELYSEQIRKAERAKELLLNYYSTSGLEFQELLRVQQEELAYRNQQIETKTKALQLAKRWEYLNDAVESSK